MAILDEKKTARTASEFKVLLCISFNSNNEAIIEKVIVVSNGKKSRNTPIAIPANAFIKVNEYEFKKITRYDPDNMIITKGGEGTEYQGKMYPAEKVKVFDVVGAGDTFLSALVYFYLLYGKIEEAIPYANKAASIAVQNFGTYVLTKEDVNEILC